MSLKALSKAILQGNQQGNQGETLGFPPGNPKETGISRKNIANSHAGPMGNARELISEDELYRFLVDEVRKVAALRDSWEGWRVSLSRWQREELRGIECRIDDAYLSLDWSSLAAEMEKYKSFVKNT